jgi:hypothetical protein
VAPSARRAVAARRPGVRVTVALFGDSVTESYLIPDFLQHGLAPQLLEAVSAEGFEPGGAGLIPAAPYRWRFDDAVPYDVGPAPADGWTTIGEGQAAGFGPDGYTAITSSPMASATVAVGDPDVEVLYTSGGEHCPFAVTAAGGRWSIDPYRPGPPTDVETPLTLPAGVHGLTVHGPTCGTLAFNGIVASRPPADGQTQVEVDNLGHSGRFPWLEFTPLNQQAIAAQGYDVSVFMFGYLAELLGTQSLVAPYVEALLARARLAREHGGACLIAAPTPIAARPSAVALVAQLDRTVAARAGCSYTTVLAHLWGSSAAAVRQGLLLPDGVHPAAPGYTLIGHALAPVIARLVRAEARWLAAPTGRAAGEPADAAGAAGVGTTGGPAPTPAARGCPTVLPAMPRAPRLAHPPSVPLGPASAELCVYPTVRERPAPTGGRLAFAATLSKTRTEALARMLDARASGPTCDLGTAAVLRLRYPGGRSLSLTAAGCDPELLAGAGGVAALGSPLLAAALSGASVPAATPGPPTATVIGARLSAAGPALARAIAGGAAPEVAISELTDPDLPFGAVAWQDPLPGAPLDAPAGTAGLVVAVRTAPACRARQLAPRYVDGGTGLDFHYGTIDLLDAAARPCALSGPLTLTGLGADGRPDTATVHEPVPATVVLSPRSQLAAPGAALVATFLFAGDVTSGGTSTACDGALAAPAAWSLALARGAGTLRIASDPPGAFVTCNASLLASGAIAGGTLSGVHLLG